MNHFAKSKKVLLIGRIPEKKAYKKPTISFLSKCSSDKIINHPNTPKSINKESIQDFKWNSNFKNNLYFIERKVSAGGMGSKTLKPSSRPKSFKSCKIKYN